VARQLRWGELTAGIIAATIIVILTLVVLLFARVGALHGKKVTLYIVTDGAPGILAGTEVWLAGEKEGVVTNITFRPPGTPALERLLIKTDFLASALPSVRRDSYAQIRPGGSMIGTPIIYIAPGTAGAPQLHEGDTVPTRPAAAIAALAEDVGKIGPEFAALGAATRDLAARIDHPVGTIGNFRANGLEDLPDVKAGMSSLSARVNGKGTVGLAMRGGLRDRASRAMAAADSIRNLLASNKGSLGRFRRDSTLATKTSRILAEVDSLSALMSDPAGRMAAGHPDSALTLELARTHVLLAALIKDVKKNPMRYIRF
jgi:phospholipid/cholesterol/gamma-HCH transport system substrate-binding protein